MTAHLELRRLINLPPDLIEALGHVSLRYGQIEHLLTMTIHRTSGLSYEEAYAAVEKLGREDILEKANRHFRAWAIRKFGQTDGDKRAEAFDDLTQKWPALAKRRHDVIHCCWSIGVDDEEPSGTRNGDLLRKDDQGFGIKEIEDLGNDLKQFVVLLNGATEPSLVSGSQKEIADMPTKFSLGYIIPANIETTATAAAIFTVTGPFTKPSDG